MPLQFAPVARAEMLIRRSVAEVFNAFVDPAVTRRFWFTRGSGRLEQGARVKWYWDMYGVSADVEVKAIEVNRRISIDWPTPVEWIFTPRPDGTTYVSIIASGFAGSDDEKVAQAIDSMGGFSLALAGCKAFLEHGVELNLVADHRPDAHVAGGA
ncbi:MAG: SRPBCC family protein [Acidobacteriia bacterium]|nr:SRPBCC family protein [Terriglobia bacterium]